MGSSLKWVVVVGVLTIISIVAGWHFYPKTVVYDEGFEEDFGGWTEDTDVPLDPNNPGSPVDWNISRITSPVKSGQHSVELYIDGRQDDGTVWIEKALSVSKNTQIQVEVSFDFYSESESFNVIADVVGFAGTSNPEVEADFTVLGQANEASGWKRYTHTATVNTGSSGEAWVAVGISVRWETEMTYNLDDVKATIS
ncbi:MAG: hypothetical protein PVH73_01135 [Candidatus Bathyarchaeota archaeon]|jgi:hypothetical protein